MTFMHRRPTISCCTLILCAVLCSMSQPYVTMAKTSHNLPLGLKGLSTCRHCSKLSWPAWTQLSDATCRPKGCTQRTYIASLLLPACAFAPLPCTLLSPRKLREQPGVPTLASAGGWRPMSAHHVPLLAVMHPRQKLQLDTAQQALSQQQLHQRVAVADKACKSGAELPREQTDDSVLFLEASAIHG